MARWPLTPTLSLALALALSLALALAQRMGLAPFGDDDEASARGARGSGTHPSLEEHAFECCLRVTLPNCTVLRSPCNKTSGARTLCKLELMHAQRGACVRGAGARARSASGARAPATDIGWTGGSRTLARVACVGKCVCMLLTPRLYYEYGEKH